MDFEHGIEKGNGKTVNREQEHMPPEHLDEDITATTIATRWNNAKAAACQSQQTHTHTRTHTHMGHDEVFSALFLYRRKGRVRWESRRECFTMTKWKLHVRTSPPGGNAICSGWGLLRHRQPSEWSGEERSKLLFEIKNRSKEDAATGQHESTSGATRLSKLLPKKWPKRTTVDSGNKRVNSPHTHTYVYLLVCVCVCDAG